MCTSGCIARRTNVQNGGELVFPNWQRVRCGFDMAPLCQQNAEAALEEPGTVVALRAKVHGAQLNTRAQ